MNAEEVRNIVQDVLENGISLDWPTYVVVLIVAGLGAYLGAYLRRKAEHLATKEDFDEILRQLKESTRATEEIRAEMNRVDWVSQRRWDAKREYYIEFLGALRYLAMFGDSISKIYDEEGNINEDHEGASEDYDQLNNEFDERGKVLARLVDEAPIFLGNEAIEVIERFKIAYEVACKEAEAEEGKAADAERVQVEIKQLHAVFKTLKEAGIDAIEALQDEATRELGLKAHERKIK